MINEYDKVIISGSDIKGVVVDIYEAQGIVFYTVESDEKGVPGGRGDEDDYKLFTCKAEDLKKV